VLLAHGLVFDVVGVDAAVHAAAGLDRALRVALPADPERDPVGGDHAGGGAETGHAGGVVVAGPGEVAAVDGLGALPERVFAVGGLGGLDEVGDAEFGADRGDGLVADADPLGDGLVAVAVAEQLLDGGVGVHAATSTAYWGWSRKACSTYALETPRRSAAAARLRPLNRISSLASWAMISRRVSPYMGSKCGSSMASMRVDQ